MARQSRRAIMSSLGVAASPLVSTRVSASDCPNGCGGSYYQGEGDESNYSQYSYEDKNSYSTCEEYDVNTPNMSLGTSIYLFDVFENDKDDNYLLQLGISTVGHIVEGADCRGIVASQGVEIDVSRGSLFAPNNSDEIAVVPEPYDSGDSSNVNANIAWTATTTALGLVNPWTSATSAAASLVSLLWETGLQNAEQPGDNAFRTYWNSSKEAQAGGHVMDFYVETYRPPTGYTHRADFDLTTFADSYREDGATFGPPSYRGAEMTKSVSVTTASITTNTSDREKLSQEEIDKLGIPEEFAKGTDVYRSGRSGSVSEQK